MAEVSLEAFQDPDFNAKAWINGIFQNSDSSEDKEGFATSVVMKLQLYIQEINRALEDTSVQVLKSLPRVVREMEALQQEATILSGQMESMKGEIAKTYEDSADSMADLVSLDKLKSRLNDTCAAVKQADNWTTLLTDVEEVFDSGDINAIAAKLEALANSLSMLSHVPDYASRSQHLEALRNRLEALASPKLVAAFSSTCAVSAKEYYALFVSMNREGQFLKYFQNFHKGVLIQEWRNVVESEVDESYQEWQDKFYEALTRAWKEQREWLVGVNSDLDADAVLLRLFASVLDSVDPSLDFCLDASLKQRAEPLSYLESVMASSDGFLKTIRRLGATQDEAAIESFVSAVYRPMRKHVGNYSTFLTAFIEANAFKQFPAENDEQQGEVLDKVADLRRQCSKFIQCVSTSHGKCMALTHGCGLAMWTEGVRVSCGKVKISIMRLLREVEAPADEWSLAQYALQTLEMVGELLSAMRDLDVNLTQKSLEDTRRLLQPKPWEKYASYFLSLEFKAGLSRLVNDLHSGDRTSLISGEIANSLEDLGKDVRKWALSLLLSPIQKELSGLTENKLVPSDVQVAALPEFSFSPQEYITQVGQFIMTLPQHLESVVSMNEKYLWAILSLPDQPYSPEGFTIGDPEFKEELGAFILACLGIGACQIYAEECLKLHQVSNNAAKQLAADIEYFGNVLDDIGVQMHTNLKALVHLLRLNPEEFFEKSSGFPPRVISAVRHMRGIASKT